LEDLVATAARTRLRPTVAAALALTTAGSFALSGCGSSGAGAFGKGTQKTAEQSKAPSDPKAQLAAGVDNLTAGSALTSVVKYGGTEAQLTDVIKAQHPTLTASDIQGIKALTTGDLTFSVQAAAGKTLKQVQADAKPGESNASFLVDYDGGPLVQLRTIGQDAYFQGDAKRILALAKVSDAQAQQTLAQLPPQYSFVKDAYAGKWLKVDAASLSMVQGQLKSLSGTAATPDATAQKQLIAQLQAALSRDFTVTRKESTAKGDHLVLTAPLRSLATDLTGVLAKLPGGATVTKSLDLSKVPDRPIIVDAYVKGTALEELSLNVAQFADPANPDDKALVGKDLPIVIDFSSASVDISAPATSTAVDLGALLKQFGGALGGASGGSTS